ncbi:ALTO [Bofec polyomavirus LSFL22]|nr:ALTO [Bofec polyomavirus LSFL22]
MEQMPGSNGGRSSTEIGRTCSVMRRCPLRRTLQHLPRRQRIRGHRTARIHLSLHPQSVPACSPQSPPRALGSSSAKHCLVIRH